MDLYDLWTFVSEENIIAVGIQYRVASLSFLYFDTEDVPGNAGMFDQLMAMQWVKDNIAQFGGNPNNITLMALAVLACTFFPHCPGIFSVKPLCSQRALLCLGESSPKKKVF